MYVQIILYLMAIVSANLAVAQFGVIADIPVSFILISFDLTIRDTLHIKWKDNGLFYKMSSLILVGSVISFLLNTEAMNIAVASFVAFFVANSADTLVFNKLESENWFRRVNVSNIVSCALDSIIFPIIAFGTIIPWLILGQFIVKFIGGFVWSFVLSKFQKTLTQD